MESVLVSPSSCSPFLLPITPTHTSMHTNTHVPVVNVAHVHFHVLRFGVHSDNAAWKCHSTPTAAALSWEQDCSRRSGSAEYSPRLPQHTLTVREEIIFPLVYLYCQVYFPVSLRRFRLWDQIVEFMWTPSEGMRLVGPLDDDQCRLL